MRVFWFRRLIHIITGSNQPQFLTRPGGENNVALHFQLTCFFLLNQVLGDFQHCSCSRGIVVCAIVDLVFLVVASERALAFSMTEMINVSAQYNGGLFTGFRVRADQSAEHITANTFFLLDVDCRCQRSAFNLETRSHFSLVEFVL